MTSVVTQHGSTSVTYRHFWRRVDPPAWPFVWRGLLPVVVLGATTIYGVTRFARSDVEDSVRREVKAQLAQQGMSWVRTSVDGQRVHLAGVAPSASAGEQAIGVARRATCDTWAGKWTCATSVVGEFTTAVARWLDVSAQYDHGRLKVAGQAPDEAARRALLDLCQAQKGTKGVREVECAIDVTPGTMPVGWDTLAARTVDVVTQCESGVAALTGGAFGVTCDVLPASLAGIQAAALKAPDGGKIGDVKLRPVVTKTACQDSLAHLLEGRKIGFATGSAVIDAASSGLLDEIGRVAGQCPGSIRIEGHTDSQGKSEENMSLSRARAQAVLDGLMTRGVTSERLVAEGFGDTKAIADNATAVGRARNRRIEFHVE